MKIKFLLAALALFSLNTIPAHTVHVSHNDDLEEADEDNGYTKCARREITVSFDESDTDYSSGGRERVATQIIASINVDVKEGYEKKIQGITFKKITGNDSNYKSVYTFVEKIVDDIRSFCRSPEDPLSLISLSFKCSKGACDNLKKDIDSLNKDEKYQNL